MKDFTKETLEAHRPTGETALWHVNFILGQLYADDTILTTDACAKNLTYEELIGSLLVAKDALEEAE